MTKKFVNDKGTNSRPYNVITLEGTFARKIQEINPQALKGVSFFSTTHMKKL